MTDRQTATLAAACWLGALVAVSLPIAVGLFAAAVAAWSRRPVMVIAAGALLATSFAARGEPQLLGAAPTAFSGEVVLASDPEPINRGVRLEVTHAGQRFDAVAWASTAGQVRSRLLGERLMIEGTLRQVDPESVWSRQRGIVGRLSIESVAGFQVGAPHHRIANSIRRTITSGAYPLKRSQQELLVGLVYGDDRFQSVVTSDDFAAAGLTHLLAVSGQNVAFVMVIAGPVLRRFDYRGRFVLTIAILFLFATLTRFEASVMRASAMAAVASLAVVSGRVGSSRRFLALAVAALVIVQPAIARSLAFQLSVAASVGILLFAPAIAGVVRGPRLWSEAVAVTTAAQLAVAPLLIWRFDEMPVASLPANVLAGPAAGPVMMWGMTGGYVAGLVPKIAPAIHLPTRWLVGWIEHVASTAASLPLGSVGATHLLVLSVSLTAVVLTRHRPLRRIAGAGIAIALVHPGVALAVAPRHSFTVDATTHIWRDASHTVVELGSAPMSDVLVELRRRDVGSVDVVVLPAGTLGDWSRLSTLRQRHEVAAIWSRRDDLVPGTIVPGTGWSLQIDGRNLTVCDDPKLLRLCE